jgi:hypothetical protein
MGLLQPAETLDWWTLVGVDDVSTPPTVARVVNTAGTRPEWRRAGFPVLFDEHGRVKHVQRGGRLYRFERVDDAEARKLRRPPPLWD